MRSYWITMVLGRPWVTILVSSSADDMMTCFTPSRRCCASQMCCVAVTKLLLLTLTLSVCQGFISVRPRPRGVVHMNKHVSRHHSDISLMTWFRDYRPVSYTVSVHILLVQDSVGLSPWNVTLWRPLLPCGTYSSKASCVRPGQAVICNCWHPDILTLKTERQSARMSRITNDGLTLSDTGCFITAVPMWQQ